jgi:starch-binding outer membrane protein SusE/F
MKQNFKILAIIAVLAISLFACKKETTNRTLLAADPGAPALTLFKDSANVDPAKGADSAVTLTWTKPSYGFDAVVAYEVEMATTQAQLGQKSSTSFILPVENVNTIAFTNTQVLELLKAAGVAPNTSAVMYGRVASYLVNSPKRARLNSNVIAVNLKRLGVATPANNELFLVGDGDSLNKWDNPVIVPNNKLVRVNEFEYGGVFYLQGGKEFLILPKNGSWDEKYCLNDGDKSLPGIEEGGSFSYKTAGGDNFKTPATTGWYKIALNFGEGKFTITPSDFVPSELWATGEAAPSNWTNMPPADQKATRLDCNTYTYKQTFVGKKLMKFLSVNGQWQPQYGQKTGGAIGMLDANLGTGSDPDPIATPDADGEYTVTVDFYNRTYSFK